MISEAKLKHLANRNKLTYYEIAKKLGISKNTVHRWFIKFKIPIKAKVAWAKYVKPHKCEICGTIIAGKRFCSNKCKNKFIRTDAKTVARTRAHTRGRSQKRKDKREEIVKQAGGKCVICGYKRNYAALQFHHRKEKNKLFSINSKNCISRSKTALDTELAKCDLLCANCHAEAHNKDKFTQPRLRSQR